MGYRIKLLAIAKSADGALELRVHPTMIPETSPVSAVSGVFNAVFVSGDIVGDLMFYGRGAGQLPTASSVWADIVEIARRHSAGQATTVQDLPVFSAKPPEIKPMADIQSSYYLRVSALDQPGVLAQVAGILGRHEISIASVIQKTHQHAEVVPVVMMTHEAQEGNVRRALTEIDALPVIAAPTHMIRVEEA